MSEPVDPGLLQFAPVIVDPTAAPVPPRQKRSRKRARRSGDGGIKLEIGGTAVRVERGADAKAVAAVIRALKVEP